MRQGGQTGKSIMDRWLLEQCSLDMIDRNLGYAIPQRFTKAIAQKIYLGPTIGSSAQQVS